MHVIAAHHEGGVGVAYGPAVAALLDVESCCILVFFSNKLQ